MGLSSMLSWCVRERSWDDAVRDSDREICVVLDGQGGLKLGLLRTGELERKMNMKRFGTLW